MWKYLWNLRTLGRGEADQVALARRLGRRGGPLALGLLRGALAQPRRKLRCAAVEALGLRGGEDVLRAVGAVLNDPEPEVRTIAVRILGESGNPAALRWLRIGADDFDAAVRAEVARAAGALRDPRSVGMLDKLLRDDLDVEVRVNTVEALGAIHDELAVRSLVRGLLDHDREVQTAARDLLCLLSHPGVIHALGPALRHRDSSVRTQAITVMKRLYDPRAIDPLLDALRDSDHLVRIEAANALIIYDDPRVREALRAATTDNHQGVREAAKHSLSMLGDKSTIPPRSQPVRYSTESLPSVQERLRKEASAGKANDAPIPAFPSDEASSVTMTHVGRGRVIDVTPLPESTPAERQKGWEKALKVQMVLRRYRKRDAAQRPAARAEIEAMATAEAVEPLLLYLKESPDEQWMVDLIGEIVMREPHRILSHELELLRTLTVFAAPGASTVRVSGAVNEPTRDVQGLDCEKVRDLARRELARRGK